MRKSQDVMLVVFLNYLISVKTKTLVENLTCIDLHSSSVSSKDTNSFTYKLPVYKLFIKFISL